METIESQLEKARARLKVLQADLRKAEQEGRSEKLQNIVLKIITEQLREINFLLREQRCNTIVSGLHGLYHSHSYCFCPVMTFPGVSVAREAKDDDDDFGLFGKFRTLLRCRRSQ